jgi:hypothetical protein
MALASAAGENAALSGLSSVMGYTSLHTSSPGTTGANEQTGGSPAYARQATTWNSPSSGSMTNASALSFNQPASTTTSHVGEWSASTAGTYYIGAALTASITTGASQGTVTFAAGAISYSAS